MTPVRKQFKSLRDAIRYVDQSYSNLGRVSIRRGLFYEQHYKQIMIEKEFAALDSLAMVVLSD